MEQSDNLQQADCSIKYYYRSRYNSSEHDCTVNIRFACFTFNIPAELGSNNREEFRLKKIKIKKEQLLSSAEEACSMIEGVVSVSCIGISNDWCNYITAKLCHNIKDIVELSPSSDDFSDWEFKVQIILRHLAVVDDSITDCHMVPTTDSSIESLGTKTIDCERGLVCSICLEEFCNGGQAACMPCLHLFHGNCIVEWLNTSHYCPMCRFEMPTS